MILTVEDVLERIESQKLLEKSSMKNTLLLNSKNLEKKKALLNKLNSDYSSEKLGERVYNMQAESILKDIDDIEERKRRGEREYEDLQNESTITKETIYQAFEHFDSLYKTATFEQRKLLLRALIKKIEVEPNRKDMKCITFWFDYDDALLLTKTGRTVS